MEESAAFIFRVEGSSMKVSSKQITWHHIPDICNQIDTNIVKVEQKTGCNVLFIFYMK
jgi:hypothetical protein